MGKIAKESTVIFRIKGDAKQLNNELAGAEKSAGGFAKGIGTKFTSIIKGVIAAAAIGKFIGKSLTEGANLEQSLGAIETLFKGSADKVKGYADEAYRTAGLSANDYMESVTSFSASLLQSLGGDTEKAADVANMALIDMSDNANKMGTSMEDIQNAYQGFAKQNYTMLDNLKLGYGGTKEEMQRLLADAQKLTGVKYDINNLSDVYNAIHAVQEELGITGTTAKESAETFSGSLASMKAAASNVLGNMALGKDITPSLNALAETTATFLFGNFIPMIGNVFKALPSAIVTFIKASIPHVKEAFNSMIQSLPDPFKNIVFSVKNFIKDFSLAFKAIGGIITGQFKTFEDLDNIFMGIFSTDQTNMILNFGNTIKNIFNDIKDTISNVFKSVGDIVGNSLVSPFDLLKSIIDNSISTIKAVFDTLSPAISTIFGGIKGFIKNFIDSFGGAKDSIGNNVSGILSFLGAFAGPIGLISFLFKNFGKQIGDTFSTIANSLAPLLSNLGSNLGNLFKSVMPLISSAISSILPVISQIVSTVMSVISTVAPVIINLVNQLLPVIMQIVQVIIKLGAALMPIIANLVSTLLPVINNIIKAVMNIVTAVAPAVIAIIQTIITIVQAMLPVITSIISVVANVVGNIITFVGTVITVVANMIAVIMSIISPIIAFIAMIISNIFSVISPIIAFIAGVFSTVFSIISGVFNTILNLISTYWNIVGGVISGITSVVSQVFNTISSTVSSVMSGVSSTVTGVFDAIKNAWNGLTGFVSGVFNGIGSAVQQLVDQVKGFVNVVIGGINGAIGLINKIPGVHIDNIPMLASGGLVGSATNAIIGEAGDEAVIPLERPKTLRKIANAIVGTMPNNAPQIAYSNGQLQTDQNMIIELYNTVDIDGKKASKALAEPIRLEINKKEKTARRLRGDRS